MGRLDELVSAVSDLNRDLGGILRDTMKDDILTGADIVARQREQLYEGLASSGAHIRPTMEEDPFFRTPGAWRRYAERKQRRFAGVPGNERRPFNVPNLNLGSGLFHGGFFVDYREDELEVNNQTIIHGVDVYRRYGAEQFGLTDDNWEGVMAHVTPMMKDRILENILPR